MSRVTLTTKNNIMSLLIYDSLHTHNVECLWMDQKYKLWTFCTKWPDHHTGLAKAIKIHIPHPPSILHKHSSYMTPEVSRDLHHQQPSNAANDKSQQWSMIYDSMSCFDIISCSLTNLRISCMLFICLFIIYSVASMQPVKTKVMKILQTIFHYWNLFFPSNIW